MVRGELRDQQWQCGECSLPDVTDAYEEDMTLETRDDVEVTPVPDFSTRPAIPYECEDVIADDAIVEVPGVGEELKISYKLFERATRGGKTLMVDSLGYTYNKKALGRKKTQHDGKCTWRCSVRSKALTCQATVSQNGSVFTRGSRPHVHKAQPGAAVKAEVTATAKSLVREKDHVFKFAATLVDRAMMQTEGSDTTSLNPVYIARNVNRLRQKVRPVEPKSLDFEVMEDHIPKDFLQMDIILDDARHLVFATTEQVTLLKNAKTWYIITAGTDGEMRVFEGLDDDSCRTHHCAEWITAVAFRGEGRCVVTLTGEVRHLDQGWQCAAGHGHQHCAGRDLEEGKPCGRLSRFKGAVTHITVRPDGKMVCCAGSDMTIHLHDPIHFKDVEIEGHKGPVLSVALDPKGEYVASSSCDGTVRVWSLESKNSVVSWDVLKKSTSFEVSETLCRLAFAPSGKLLAVPVDTKVHVYDREGWRADGVLACDKVQAAISPFAFSPCGSVLAGACMDGTMALWFPGIAASLEGAFATQVCGHHRSGPAPRVSPRGGLPLWI
ncbi:WD repeat and HMG-box DNA-binding protein 1 [Chionoecetes opilio]|uniref:WD repeat and HMG-box DNA-binding protein 1 n=2 Tax=Chionoecetes opilio TaxID=41210 RepID=A0A8J5CT52_CHIOP|nr:WD repeat and HMG-box DNA-binding protein 1 [Chionoecetes opilio]